MSATASLTLQAASLFQGLSANKQEIDATRAEGDYATRVAARNAEQADRQAADAAVRGDLAANRYAAGTRALVGSQRAALAAQGVDLGSGTPLALQEDTARMGAIDAMTIRNNARREALGFTQEAANYRTQGELAQRATDNTVDALKNKRYTTLLTGASSLTGQWMQNPPSFTRRPMTPRIVQQANTPGSM